MLNRPIAQTDTPTPPASAAAVELARPVVLGAPAPGRLDPRIQQVSFAGNNDGNWPVARSQVDDIEPPLPSSAAPRPFPTGGQLIWHRADPEPIHMPQAEPPLESGPVQSGPALNPGTPLARPLAPGYTDDGCGSCMEACPCSCDPDGSCCCYPGNRFYASAEALFWMTNGDRLPPLVTTGPADAGRSAGGIGVPGTQILYGNQSVGDQLRTGGRFMAGYWFDDCRQFGLEAGFLFLGSANDNFIATSDGSRVLTRPALIMEPFATRAVEVVGRPAAFDAAGNLVVPAFAGAIQVSHHSSFWGSEANFRSNLLCGENYFLDGLLGFRSLNLSERLDIVETPQILTPSIFLDTGFTAPPGAFFAVNQELDVVHDSFATKNRFYGGQVGLAGETRYGPVSFGFTGKLGLGSNQQSVDIIGTTSTTVFPGPFGPGFNVLSNGGFLALGSNIGHYTRNVFSVTPELTLNVGYQLTDHVRAFVGYNFMYWSNVVRPGQQIDLAVNASQPPLALVPGVVGTPRPVFAFHGSDFYAQGAQVGLEVRY